jgi:hypothetical protein
MTRLGWVLLRDRAMRPVALPRGPRALGPGRSSVRSVHERFRVAGPWLSMLR